jgi:hypothetical protein
MEYAMQDDTLWDQCGKKVARVHHLQKMNVQLKDHWMNFMFE